MLILHGCWVPSGDPLKSGHFFVWGENTAAYYPGKRRGRQPKSIPSHTLAAPEREILDIIREIADKKILLQGYLVPRKNVMMLPANPGYLPVSPRLAGILDQRPGGSGLGSGPDGGAELSPWVVPGLALPAQVAVSFLSRLSISNQSKDRMWGDDLLFWSLAGKFTLELLIRQRFIPSVLSVNSKVGRGTAIPGGAGERRRGDVNYAAAWLAVFRDPEDFRRLTLLGEAMPPLCRAVRPESSDPERGFAPLPGEVLAGDFLYSAVDGLVRTWFKPRPERLHSTLKTAAAEERKLVERWLSALFTDHPFFPADWSDQLKALAEQACNWADALAGRKGSSAFRTCFRLEPPPEPDKEEEMPQKTGKHRNSHREEVRDWTLSFHLQASDDPSLLIPAGVVWKETKASLKILGRIFENPQERLLADLGRACSLFFPVRESLESAAPSGCALTAGESYLFLREAVPLLEESGFGVLVPAWWQQSGGPRAGIKIKVRPAGKSAGVSEGAGSGMMGLNTLVDYNWELALGDRVFSQDEFLRLADLKTPLVRVRGQWVELSPGRIEEALKLLSRSQGAHTLAEILRLSASAGGQSAQPGAGEEALPVIDIEGVGWVADLLDRLSGKAKLEELAAPDGFCGTLRDYQKRGFSWLHFLSERGIGACLADDMGLGKTIQFITLLLYRKEQGLQKGPVFLVCPTSVVGNWQRELERFAPSVSVLFHHGGQRLSGESFIEAAGEADVVVSTYALAHRDQKDLLAVKWDGVVLDEAQNIKNAAAKQAQSVRRLRSRFRIALTGTPVENRLSELWSIMDFLNPSFLGSYNDFRSRFAVPVERYNDEERLALLQKMVGPFILRRLKTDPLIINDLPEKQELKVYCHLTPEQATLYQAVVQDMLERIEVAEGIERRGLVLAALTKLKQVCNHPSLFTGDAAEPEGRSGKLARLTEILEEVTATGDRALIFSQFAVMGDLLKKYLQKAFGQEVLFLHGGVPARQRDVLVERFQEEKGGPQLFVLSLKAGGLGLNLTRASHVVHFDRWWNPAVENQATDRAFRIGQKKNVLVHKFICSGTLEERIDEMIEKKRALAESVVSAGESWLTELNTGQLRELFALGAGAADGDD